MKMERLVSEKLMFSILLILFFPFFIYGVPHTTVHTENADYSLMPDCDFARQFSDSLGSDFTVNTCYQDYSVIPKTEAKGKTPSEIMHHLELMGGEVRYFDIPKQKYIPIFRECDFNEKKNQLCIRDKNFGRMYCLIELYEEGKNCAVKATLCRPLANPLFWEIKKNEFNIFVMTNETEENLELYILIQSSYKMNWLLKSRIENAFAARINGMQDWFVRMYLGLE